MLLLLDNFEGGQHGHPLSVGHLAPQLAIFMGRAVWVASPMSWARAKSKPISSDGPSSANSNAVSERRSGGLTGAIMSKSERHWLHQEKLHARPQPSSGMAAVPEWGLKHRGHGRGQHDFPELGSPVPSGAFSARSRRITPCPQQRMCYE